MRDYEIDKHLINLIATHENFGNNQHIELHLYDEKVLDWLFERGFKEFKLDWPI